MVDLKEKDDSRRRLQSFRIWILFYPLTSLFFVVSFYFDTTLRGSLSTSKQSVKSPRILYIITSVRERNRDGYDRFLNNMVPLASEGIRTMIDAGFHVDLYLIADYEVTEERRLQLLDALPASVGLQIWGDATPLYYPARVDKPYHRDPQILSPKFMVLARQHRYVIKDKFPYYDMFVNFEDDMYVTATHVKHYREVSEDLYHLRQHAPEQLPGAKTKEDMEQSFFGTMTQAQLTRMIPGFIRVEATQPDFQPFDDTFDYLKRDFAWNDTLTDVHVDPTTCCEMQTKSIPKPYSSDSLYMWETSIDTLSIRKMPETSSTLSWVLLQGGNLNEASMFPSMDSVVGEYWTGRDGQFEKRPCRDLGWYASNQGGWMGTSQQLLDWQDLCTGNFLPPFEAPIREGGLRDNVEFWSGSLQMFGPKSCKLQRIVGLDPDNFSSHLLYHTTNNKQKRADMKSLSPREYNNTDPVRLQFATGNMNQVWGELNAIRKNAERRMLDELSKH